MVLGTSMLVSNENEFVLNSLFIYQYHPDAVLNWEGDAYTKMLWWGIPTVFKLHIVKKQNHLKRSSRLK